MSSSEALLEAILRREGGYVDHPADKGGPTNFGITQAVLGQYRGRPASVLDVKTLSRDEAKEIYRKLYVAPFDFVGDPALNHLLVDSGVNHGVKRAIQWLQAAVGVTPDGVVGPLTRDALRRQTAADVYRRVLRRRIIFYGQIIKNNPSQAVFAEGWARRVAEFV